MTDITQAIRSWAQDLDEAGIFELRASVEAESLPPRWPGTLLALNAGEWTLTLDPDAPFGRLCIDPASEHYHFIGRSLCDFDFLPTDWPRLDRGLALIHALSEAVDQSSQCLKDWQRYITGKGNSGKWRVLDEPCAPDFPEPYTIYMKQEFGKPPPGGELSPIGRMMALQVALRHHLRSANVSQHIASGGSPALNASVMQRGLLMEPEGRMNWDFFGCVDELHELLAEPAPGVASDAESDTIGSKHLCDAPILARALLAIADSKDGIRPEQLARSASDLGGSKDDLQRRDRQHAAQLRNRGWPIRRSPYRLEWHNLTDHQRTLLNELRDSRSD